MAYHNTRMTATNTLNKGLVMDFNPTITKDDCLTNALNATLLTFNGNEMQLQQDMGNGRVETAFLPEGYVPVGTCEFGDIIYIVSYNPLENKSQIGCFPSPERNITSDEITEMQQALSNSDFQKTEGGVPTGVINSMAVKKIVYGNKNMNPGDKYIIYEESATGSLEASKQMLSDYGNTSHTHNTWPKLVKLKVVSIEDSGKIVDLNAAVKWYDNDYYIPALAQTATQQKPDLDSYRSLVSSAYSIFQSKVSGKLAILAELETIDGFSCTYDVYTENTEVDGVLETKYLIYFYTSWDTSHNDVNPSGFIFTKSAWSDGQDGGKLFLPTKGSSDEITYEPKANPEDLPYEAASTINASTGQIEKYDDSQVIQYERLYELDDPSGTYAEFIESDSYNAQINDIIDWKKEGTDYKAVDASAKYENLRTVTKVTRLLEPESGVPQGTNDNWQYVYNLDSYEVDDTGAYTYKTKGIDGTLINLLPITLTDDVINNYFHKDIPKLLDKEFKLTRQSKVTAKNSEGTEVEVVIDNDLSRMIWNYTIAPVMPYGVLDYLAVSGSIDFSKLGTGLIDLTAWRYYNSGNVSTLTWGLEAYPEPNKGIAEVVMDFFDNQGIAASYHITGKTSFSGMFTEQIILGQQNSSYKMNAIDCNGEEYIHAGMEDEAGKIGLTDTNTPYLIAEGDTPKHGPYKNDAGTLYPNMLYLVKITVKYCAKDIIGNFDTENSQSFKTFYRWFWTNGLFNEYYYSMQDFKPLQPQLSLDFSTTFSTKGDGGTNPMQAYQYLYRQSSDFSYSDRNDLYKTLGANVYAINQKGEDDTNGNVLMTLEPGLGEGFNTFNLLDTALNVIDKIKVSLGNSEITKDIEVPSLNYTGEAHTTTWDDSIQPILATKLCSHDSSSHWDRTGYVQYKYGANNAQVSQTLLELLVGEGSSFKGYTGVADDAAGAVIGNTADELYSKADSYKSYLDAFSLNMIGASWADSEDLTYLDSQGNTQTVKHYQTKTVDLNTARTTGIKLALTGITFSKIFASEMDKDSSSKRLKSIICSTDANQDYQSLKAAGLHLYTVGGEGHLYFNNVITWHMGESGGRDTRWGSSHQFNITNASWTGTEFGGTWNDSHDEWRPKIDNGQVQELWKKQLTAPLAAFVPCRSTSSNGKIDYTWITQSVGALRRACGTDLQRSDNRLHPSRGSCPGQDAGKWDSDDHLYYSFMVFDQEQNIVVPFADFFIGKWNDQRSRNGNPVAQTLADMLGSLLAQIYVLDTEYEGNGGLIKNFVTLQSYNEIWSKDIVIEANTDSLTPQDIEGLITIQRLPVKTYLQFLEDNSKAKTPDYHYERDLEENKNVTLGLLGVKRAVTFQFTVPYSLGNILYEYNKSGESSNVIQLSVIEGSETSLPEEKFTANVTANTLYTWTGDNVIPFGQGTVMKYAKSFKSVNGNLGMIASNTTIKSSSFVTLAKVLHYDGGELTWHGLNQFSSWNNTYDIGWEGTGDNPMLKGFPNISLFNLYNPGKA